MSDSPPRARRRFAAVLPGLLLPGVLFVVLPLQIYLPNRADFSSDALPWFAGLALASFAAVLASAWLPSTRWREGIARAFFFGGLYVLLADALAPTTLPVLDGREVGMVLPEPLAYTLVELGLLAGAVAGALLAPTRLVRSAGAILLVVFCGWELAHFAWVRVAEGGGAPQTSAPAPDSGRPGRPNVYHLIFDAFSSDGFEEILDDLDVRSRFDGFVYFPRNRANHTLTNFSFPSFLTSRLIEPEGFSAWRKSAQTGRSGLLRDVRDAGYDVWSYGPREVRCRFQRCTSIADVETPTQRRARVLGFFEIWLLRVAPNVLQSEVHGGGRGALRWLAVRSETSILYVRAQAILGLVDRMAEDAARSPATNQFVHAHFLLPHLPFVLGAGCGYAGAELTYERLFEIPPRHYRAQATCVVRHLVAFLDRLRELGRYEDSAIVIHSDHGNVTRCADGEGGVSEETSRRMQAVALDGRSGHALDCLSRALLLVKPAGAPTGVGLAVSDRETQLLDLRPTIRSLAGLGEISAEGADVLAADFPAARDVHLLSGGFRPTAGARPTRRGKLGTLCVQVRDGELNHFVYSPARGLWRILPNLFVRC